MTSPRDIAVLVGSLRKASYNRKIANVLAELAPPSLALEIIEIGDLPLYNEDRETTDLPPAWTQFRERIRRADGVLFVTPEYNRSVSGVLKNAIDVGSRPYVKSVWPGKPGGVVSATTGAMGAFGANHHLRQALVFLDVPVLQQTEAYIGGVDKLFDGEGHLINDKSRELLGKFIKAYAAWVERILADAAPH